MIDNIIIVAQKAKVRLKISNFALISTCLHKYYTWFAQITQGRSYFKIEKAAGRILAAVAKIIKLF